MLEKLRNFPNQLRREIARRKARRTAIQNGHEIFRSLSTGSGYKFVPSGDAFFYVYAPSSDLPAYDLQVYYDPAIGAWSYLCGCPSCSAWSVCKHGVALVLYLEAVAPIYVCALEAPVPPLETPKRSRHAAASACSPGEGLAIGSHVYHPVKLSDPQFAGYLTISTETANYGGYAN